MYKKIIITLVVFIVSAILSNSVIFAQKNGDKSPEDKAKQRSERLTKLLDLTSDQSSKIYDIYLDHFNQIKNNRQNQELTRLQKKEQAQKIYQNTEQKLKGVLNKEQYDKWNACKKMNKDKNKNKYNKKNKKGKSHGKNK
jgi:HD superfamily phosphohydrolase